MHLYSSMIRSSESWPKPYTLSFANNISWTIQSKTFENLLEIFIWNLSFWQQEKNKLSNKIYLKLTSNLLSSYQSLFYSRSEVRDSRKCSFGKMSFGEQSTGDISLGKCPSGKKWLRENPLGKCLSRKSWDTYQLIGLKFLLHFSVCFILYQFYLVCGKLLSQAVDSSHTE